MRDDPREDSRQRQQRDRYWWEWDNSNRAHDRTAPPTTEQKIDAALHRAAERKLDAALRRAKRQKIARAQMKHDAEPKPVDPRLKFGADSSHAARRGFQWIPNPRGPM